LDPDPPSATTLYNYDTDRDDFPGLLIHKGGTGPTDTDSTKVQVWRATALPHDLPGGSTIEGTVRVILWSGMKDFEPGKTGSVSVFLGYVSQGKYAEIGHGSLTEADWQGGSDTWVEKPIDITGVHYTVPASSPAMFLDLRIIVNDAADDDMWFAYDTTTYDSRVELPSAAGAFALTEMTTATGMPAPATTPTEIPRFRRWSPGFRAWLCTRYSWLCD